METTVTVRKEKLYVLAQALERERKALELEVDMTLSKIQAFENKYGLSTTSFLEQYEKGLLGDHEEFVEWYGESKFSEKAREDLEAVQEMLRSVGSA